MNGINARQAFGEKLRIYNLFPKLAGSMTEWLKHIPRIAAMGFNAIYVNPFHYSGFSGSLYSVSEYYKFKDEFIDHNCGQSPEAQLKTVIARTHQYGMKFIMDLVINHTAIDSPLTKEHPAWYLKDNAGNILNPFVIEEDGKKVVWGDLAEIDNENSSDLDGLYKYWLDMITYYMRLGVNGFRCDAAYKIPTKLWNYILSNIRKEFPESLFLAETLGCEIKDVIKLAEAGFDYTFNSAKYWNYNDPWLLNQYKLSYEKTKGIPSIGFPESHDTRRLFEETNSNLSAVKQKHQFVAFFSSGLMIPLGFEYGFKKRINVVNTNSSDYETNTGIDISDFIKTVNEIKKNHAVFNEECAIEIVDQSNWQNVICIRKSDFNETERALIIINKDVNNYQNVYFDSISNAVGTKQKVMDISPEYRLDNVNERFEYNLRPGQVIVLYSKIK